MLGVSASAGDLAHTHLVAVYDRNDALAATTAEFLADALDRGGTAVVIATLAHRRAIASALVSRGAALDDLVRAGRYRSLDARDTLDSLLRAGHPDPDLFSSAVGEMLSSAARAGRPVHVFGEMVAILWDDGNVAAALDLESLWNRVDTREPFALLCAYPRSVLEERGDLASAKGMCDRHSAVLPLTSSNGRDARGPDARDDVCERLFLVAPTAPHEARAFVRDVLDRWGECDDGESEIIASELATNAVRHARSPFRVRVSRTRAGFRIAVSDASSDRPEHIMRDDYEFGGRGVRLVAALSAAWGTEHEAGGKTVWAEVART
jgi:anti-sigma regulatory factor (Ser/Thr protein kinase)